MFLGDVRAARFAAAHLLIFTAALVLMARKVGVLETQFDEANTSTNEFVVQKSDSSLKSRRLDTAIIPVSTLVQRLSVGRIVPVYAGQSTDSHKFRKPFCTLLC